MSYEINYNGGIYTTDISRCYKLGIDYLLNLELKVVEKMLMEVNLKVCHVWSCYIVLEQKIEEILF